MLTVLIDMVSIGLIVPVLPVWIGHFTRNPTEQMYAYGAVAFTFGIANFFASPILGALSDRHGRRPVLLLGFCGFAISFFATALATELWMLIGVRLISGALQANAAVANAYVADITPPQDRAKRFGQLGAMFGLGFILGPVIGGLLGAIDLRWPFFAAGTLALLNLVYGYFVLPESLPPERRNAAAIRSLNPVAALMHLGQLKGVGGLIAVSGLCTLAQFVLHTSWVLYTGLRFGWGPGENGWSLFTVGVASTLVQGVLLQRLLKRFGATRLATIGLVSATLAHLAWALATQGWVMYAVIACNLFGFTVAAALQSIVSNAADERTQGQTMGAMAGLTSLTAVVAPLLGSVSLGLVSHLPRDDWRVGAPFFLCTLFLAIATGIAIRHFARHPVPSTAPAATPAG